MLRHRQFILSPTVGSPLKGGLIASGKLLGQSNLQVAKVYQGVRYVDMKRSFNSMVF